ncbi:MAG: fluoride efflux transporter CrcB [Rhodobacteraceae bacterium]|nr:fluoride efflux transporter CrcB [Paracoccaceae bacterium]
MIWTLIQVAIGGAIGAIARYMTNIGLLRLIGPGFPWGTLTVNVVGSFLMGLAWVLLDVRGAMRFAPLVMTGVLGGFTTFSAFSLDAVTMVERGQAGLGLIYVAVSVAASIGALFAGVLIARGVLA